MRSQPQELELSSSSLRMSMIMHLLLKSGWSQWVAFFFFYISNGCRTVLACPLRKIIKHKLIIVEVYQPLISKKTFFFFRCATKSLLRICFQWQTKTDQGLQLRTVSLYMAQPRLTGQLAWTSQVCIYLCAGLKTMSSYQWGKKKTCLITFSAIL